MIKRLLIYIYLLLVCVLTFVGCNIMTEGSSDDIYDYENPLVFKSIEDFTDYILDEAIVMASVDDTQHTSFEETFREFMKSSRETNNYLQVPNLSVFKASMNAGFRNAVIGNASIAYLFDLPIDQEKMLQRFGSADVDEIAAAMNQEVQAYKDSGMYSTITGEDIISHNESLMIEYYYLGNGESTLQVVKGMNPLNTWENHPGFFYAGAPYSDMENPPSYMVYWVMGDYYYQASVPASQLETFWAICDNMMTSYSAND